MKAKRFFHVLAASVMLAATAGLLAACTSNDQLTDTSPPPRVLYSLGPVSIVRYPDGTVRKVLK